MLDGDDLDRMLQLTAHPTLPEEEPFELVAQAVPRDDALVADLADEIAKLFPPRITGAQVRGLREMLELTQFDFACYGLNYRQITHWEAKRDIRLLEASTRDVFEAVARRMLETRG